MTTRRYTPAEAVLIWFIFILIFAVGLLAIAARHALAASDEFVRRIEFMLHTAPGQLIPANPSFPDLRLQYLGAREIGHGVYEVRIKRLP